MAAVGEQIALAADAAHSGAFTSPAKVQPSHEDEPSETSTVHEGSPSSAEGAEVVEVAELAKESEQVLEGAQVAEVTEVDQATKDHELDSLSPGSGAAAGSGEVPKPVTEGPQGHSLKVARAPAGKCDGCGRKVAEGEVVMDDREKNYYICSSCKPIASCPEGHGLHTSIAVPGRCDGCGRTVKQGEVVSDCRICDWYLCSTCQPSVKSEVPESLCIARQRAGKCAVCKEPTVQEDVSIVSNGHIWHLCAVCAVQGRTVIHGDPAVNAQAHTQSASIAEGCESEAGPESRRTWQCPKGHKLEACPATEGRCDGCQRRVATNQCVLNCKECNWYLCGSCHLPVARAGA
jgi:hypothetical protein